LEKNYDSETIKRAKKATEKYSIIPDEYNDEEKFQRLGDIEKIDSGEQILFSVTPQSDKFLILTGDKSSISALNNAEGVDDIKAHLKDKIIFLEGDPAEAFYFIKSGQVKISKLSEAGREIIVHILGPGDYFAEATLFHKESTYPATAEVIEDAVIGMIKNEKLEMIKESILKKDSRFSNFEFEICNLELGDEVIAVDPNYYRPTEVDLLIGDASKAKQKLDWQAETKLEKLVEIMVKSDFKNGENEKE